jgi:hypothetical protein
MVIIVLITTEKNVKHGEMEEKNLQGGKNL